MNGMRGLYSEIYKINENECTKQKIWGKPLPQQELAF